MQEASVTKLHLNLLWQKAQETGFTAEALRRMLILLNLDPKNMSVRDFTALMPYVNAMVAPHLNVVTGTNCL